MPPRSRAPGSIGSSDYRNFKHCLTRRDTLHSFSLSVQQITTGQIFTACYSSQREPLVACICKPLSTTPTSLIGISQPNCQSSSTAGCTGALDASWHWYRYEWQTRGSIHAHGCAKLKNDPGLCNLITKAAKGWEAQQKLSDPNADHEELQGNHCRG